MKRMRHALFLSFVSVGALALCFAPRAAWSHDRWLELEPAQPQPLPAKATKVYLVTGDALRQAELLPLRRADSVRRFQLVSSAGQRDLRGELREDQQPVAVLEKGVLAPGTSLLTLDTAPIDILLTAEKFQSYLFEEGLIDVLMQRASRAQEEAPGRERYSRSLKTLIQIGDRYEEVAQRPVGQELEIIPLTNPFLLSAGAPLRVQVLYRGKPLPGRAVTFSNRYHSNIVTRAQRSDAQGQVVAKLERPGDWLVALVHMEPSSEPGADWRSYWSSLTFTLPEPAPSSP